jgi:hypothetical protein
VPPRVVHGAACPVNVAMIDSLLLRMAPDFPWSGGRNVMAGVLAFAPVVSAGDLMLWGGAGLALAFAVAARLGIAGAPATAGSGRRLAWPGVCRGVAWASFLVTFVGLASWVGSRYLLAVREVVRGAPLEPQPVSELGWIGLTTTAVLLLTGWLLHRGSRDSKRLVLIFWVAILAASCTALLVPTYYPTDTGSYVRSARALILTVGVAAVLCATVGLTEGPAQRRRRRVMPIDAAGLPEPALLAPGLRISAGVAGVLLLLLTCYGLASPVELHPGGYALSALILGAAAAAGGAVMFGLVARQWSVDLADLAMGLVTLAVCAWVTACIPSEPRELAVRSPITLNAIVIGLAGMAWVWSWLSRVWEQQLDEGQPWTTAGRLVSPSGDFSFLVAAVALTLALLMAGWPMIPGIAASDSSRGRILFGVAGHLLLLLSVLACARRSGRASFIRLAVLVVLSLLIFLGVRAIG